MPDLPATFELGPNLQWHVARGRFWALDLRLPVRAVITIEGPPRHAGWTAVPQLALDTRWGGWNVGALVGASFGDRRVHALYYEVAPEFATPARPAYRAEGGRAGWQMIGVVSRRIGELWFGAYFRADRLDDAVFVTSPLVRQRGSLAGGLAFAWVFGQSATRVAPRTPVEGGSP
jgi:hypothetical protein